MPTYEYECEKCGHNFDVFQNMADKPVRKCPKCLSSVRRLMGAGAGIIFKGSGFYETDYKSKKNNSEPKSCPNALKGNSTCGSCAVNNGGGK